MGLLEEGEDAATLNRMVMEASLREHLDKGLKEVSSRSCAYLQENHSCKREQSDQRS